MLLSVVEVEEDDEVVEERLLLEVVLLVVVVEDEDSISGEVASEDDAPLSVATEIPCPSKAVRINTSCTSAMVMFGLTVANAERL